MSVHSIPSTMVENLSPEQQTRLVRTARSAVGDELRSLTYFTDDTVEQLYLRDDLDRSADLVGFAENERMGFHTRRTYRGTQLGQYQFTIRAFEHGYLTRVITGDLGAWVTTDPMGINRFEELGTALKGTLQSL